MPKNGGRAEIILREQGARVTPQRVAILMAVAATGDHPDADSVYRHVSREYPHISRDTVYRTLSMMEEKKIIGSVLFGGASKRYDPNTRKHHHLICLRCRGSTIFPRKNSTASKFHHRPWRGLPRYGPPCTWKAFVTNVRTETAHKGGQGILILIPSAGFQGTVPSLVECKEVMSRHNAREEKFQVISVSRRRVGLFIPEQKGDRTWPRLHGRWWKRRESTWISW